jgi:hypothetical protein
LIGFKVADCLDQLYCLAVVTKCWQVPQMLAAHRIRTFPLIRLILKYLREMALLALPVVSVHLEWRMLIQERARAVAVGGDIAVQVGHKATSSVRGNAFLLAATFLLVTALGVAATSLPNQEGSDSQVVGPLEPLRSAVTGYSILAELVAHNERRSGALLEYKAVKRHQVIDSRGEMYAEEIARIEYHAPDKKTFVVTSEKGWGPIGHFTLDQLIASEIEAIAGGDDRDSSITPANY